LVPDLNLSPEISQRDLRSYLTEALGIVVPGAREATYPNIIWPCGNDTGLTIITLQPNAGGAGAHSTVTWNWSGPTEEPIEVYVR
jgi:hypothetical protein